jgi:hypothetical protein
MIMLLEVIASGVEKMAVHAAVHPSIPHTQYYQDQLQY